MKSFIFLILIQFSLVGISYANSAKHTHDHFTHLPEGGRRALHGMVLFGSGPYFLEHIPMLTSPHDFQIITEVILKNSNGVPLKLDFSHQGFTLKPSTSFSLNDYVAGRLKTFSGSIHQGSFEQNGKIVSGLDNVSVEIRSYQTIRQLPSIKTLEKWIKVGDKENSFESNVINPNQNFQLIRNSNTGKVIWCVKAPDFFDPC